MQQLKGDSGAAIVAQKDSPVNYGLQFRNIASLKNLFLHHEDNTKIIIIIQQGYRYHLNQILTRKDIYIKVGGERGGPGITPPPIRIYRDSGVGGVGGA